MQRAIFIAFICLIASPLHANDDAKLVKHLRQVYDGWRSAMIRKDGNAWKRLTSQVRQVNVRNRVLSERRPFPGAVFAVPAAPPNLASLKALRVRVNGPTAKATYYGKVDFGVGGKPTKNLLVISYQQETSGWKYHGSEFINLSALPEVRKEIDGGNLKFVDHEDFKPNGVREKPPIAVRGVAPYIAKAYVYCPGREVKLLINNISSHIFQDTKAAEIVIGGAFFGENSMQFAIKDIPGGNPNDPMTIRIYLFSQIPGTKPLKALEYQLENGEKPEANGTKRFRLTKEMVKGLR